jgi:hypothetical protein
VITLDWKMHPEHWTAYSPFTDTRYSISRHVFDGGTFAELMIMAPGMPETCTADYFDAMAEAMLAADRDHAERMAGR